MDKEFETFDHTADIGIRAYGADPKQAFVNAAKGMFSLIVEPDSIAEAEHREVNVTAEDREGLLVEWLNELVYLFDVENMLFKRFDIVALTDTELKAAVYGEKVDRTRHQLQRGIKAVTYHMLKIEQDNNGYRVQYLVDV